MSNHLRVPSGASADSISISPVVGPGLRGCSIGHGLRPAAAKKGAPSDAVRLGSAGGRRLQRGPLLLSLACHWRLRLLLLLQELRLRPLPPADLLLLPACPRHVTQYSVGFRGQGWGCGCMPACNGKDLIPKRMPCTAFLAAR